MFVRIHWSGAPDGAGRNGTGRQRLPPQVTAHFKILLSFNGARGMLLGRTRPHARARQTCMRRLRDPPRHVRMVAEVHGRARYQMGRVNADRHTRPARACLFRCNRAEASLLDPISQRMQSFVEGYGDVPRDARRLEDHEARNHATPWLRHHLGRGIVAGDVIGYQLGDRWWTFFFERVSISGQDGPERWRVEAYDCSGRSWSRNYLYLLEDSRWRPA